MRSKFIASQTVIRSYNLGSAVWTCSFFNAGLGRLSKENLVPVRLSVFSEYYRG